MMTLCSIPQLRWEINNFNTGNFDELNWAGFQFINYVAFFTLISVMLVFNCFSDKAPRNSSYPKYSNPSPEISASMLNRAFFFFFDRTTWKGWRHPLTEKNIYDINPENASRELVPEFDKNFQASLDKQRRSGSRCTISISLVYVLLSTSENTS
jgi:ATP-binding cassette subfamily C (CFTR/MRP) protein 1